MSQEAMMKVLEKASTDTTFRDELKKNPEAALKGYDLTADECAALTSGDASKIESMGVDARVSKLQGSWFETDNSSFASGGSA